MQNPYKTKIQGGRVPIKQAENPTTRSKSRQGGQWMTGK